LKDEAARRFASNDARKLVELSRAEALRLLGAVDVGRIVFTSNALPAVRPVNHLLEDGEIIVRTRLSATFSTAINSTDDPGTVVAYEADQLDSVARLGWSVVVTGVAKTITDPDRLARYERLLRPWADMVMDSAIGITVELVSGFRFVESG
jgi:hypothetical protein